MIKSTPCQSLQQMQQIFLEEAEEDAPCPCWSRGDGTSQDKVLFLSQGDVAHCLWSKAEQ